jgi:hypothetical protein
MSLGADVSLAQRQSGLGAFESLTLALFIAAEYQGMLWRIEIKACSCRRASLAGFPSG